MQMGRRQHQNGFDALPNTHRRAGLGDVAQVGDFEDVGGTSVLLTNERLRDECGGGDGVSKPFDPRVDFVAGSVLHDFVHDPPSLVARGQSTTDADDPIGSDAC